MSKSPETIIEDFETRRSEEKSARRKKRESFAWRIVRRSLECVLLGLAMGSMAWGPKGVSSMFAPVFLFIYLGHALQSRWVIEDELRRMKEDLKQRA